MGLLIPPRPPAAFSYTILCPKKTKNKEDKETAEIIMEEIEMNTEMFRFGHTKACLELLE